MNNLFFDFSGFRILFIVFLAAVIAFFIAVAVKGAVTWNRNNRSPILTISAAVAEKRCGTTRHHIPNAGDPTGAHGFQPIHSTQYYVRFQPDAGSPIELQTDKITYGTLVEGEHGMLTYQGSRFLRFERI